MKRFEGKIALITGSSNGIGFECAQRIMKEGGKVVINSRKKANVDAAVKRLGGESENVCGFVCHIGNAEQRAALLQHVVKKYGKIDVLVLNVAISPALPSLADTSKDAFDKIFDVNVTQSMLFVNECLPHIPKNAGSSVCFISSIGGFSPNRPHPAYGISKTAVFGLTKALASELALEGIRVNCVAPGMVKTNFSQPIWSDKNIESSIANMTLLNRLGEAHEIASAVAFLTSNDASYITSEILVVSGGMVASRL